MAVGHPTDLTKGTLVTGLAACAALIEGGLLAILLLGRPADHVPEYISFYFALSIPYVTACWLITRGARRFPDRIALRWIWAASLLFRLTVLPLDPSLSEDATRYRWQGLVQDAGGDPYLAIPEEGRWEGLRDSTWERVSTKDKPSAYGPVLEQLNLWYYRLAVRLDPDPWGQVWLFKLPFALADLAAGLALMALLSAVGRSRAWVLIYLWSPLAVTEFWIEGHNDAVAVAFALAALVLSERGRKNWALVLLAVATMCKFWPAVLSPFLLVTRDERRWRVEWTGVLASAAVGIVLCLPYWNSIVSVGYVLAGLMGGWRNNDSLFALLVHLAGGELTPAALAAMSALVITVGSLRFLRLPPVAGELAAVCALLLLSANCFPWYLTWMLPLLAVHPMPALLLWTALVPLAYHVVPAYEATGTWHYVSALTLAEYLPVLLWLGALAAGRAIHTFRAPGRSGGGMGVRRPGRDGR